MIFCDLIHGYQPFNHQKAPIWVKKNLKNIFLPTSLSMKKGLIKRGVQLQGWTIENWLKSPNNISDLAKKTLNNIKKAIQKKNLEIGTSAYAHSILPLLSNDLIRAELILDRETNEKYLGKPTWFWPPEGAINKRVIKIIHQVSPDLIILLSDNAFKNKRFNGPIKIKIGNKFQKAIVFSTLFKSLFMNAEPYRKKAKYKRRPKHLPKEMVWSQIRRVSYSFPAFKRVLDFMKNNLKTDSLVLMRDWENAGSTKALKKQGKIKENRHFLKIKDRVNFILPSQFDWTKVKTYSLNKVYPCSWDIESSSKDPFPWWSPNKKGKVWSRRTELKRKKNIEWQEIIKEFDRIFQRKIKQKGGFKKAFQDEFFKKRLKESLPAIHSCIGWHYIARKSWKNYRFAEKQLKEIVQPCMEKLKNI